MKKKIVINKKVIAEVELPDGKNAYDTFVRIMKQYKKREGFYVGVLELALKQYEKQLESLDIYIELAKVLDYTCSDAKMYRNKLEFAHDRDMVHLDIPSALILINKEKADKTEDAYLFWDMENFSNIAPTFNHIIEPFAIEDSNIYVICNPDSLYLFRKEWEADLYDYSKTLDSFEFSICDHGKNVADDRLLERFEFLALQESDVYILTYDRELKERFNKKCHKSNNLYILNKKIL